MSCLIFPFIFSPSFVFFVVVDGTDHEINRERRRGSFVFVFFCFDDSICPTFRDFRFFRRGSTEGTRFYLVLPSFT